MDKPPLNNDLDALRTVGVTRDDDGGIRIPGGLWRELVAQKARQATLSSVPSTPHMPSRDVGGGLVRPTGQYPHLSTQQLRDFRNRSLLLEILHRDRAYKVRKVCVPWTRGKAGIRVVHKNHLKWNDETPEGFERYIEQFESILWNPAPSHDYTTLGTVLALLMEDLLTINNPVVEPLFSLYDRTRIVGWKPVDGGLIMPTMRWAELYRTTRKDEVAFGTTTFGSSSLSSSDVLDLLSLKMRMDLTVSSHVLVREGIPLRGFLRGELLVAPQYNRTDIRYAGYSPSHVEGAYNLIEAFTNAFDYNANFLSMGFMAENAIGIPYDLSFKDAQAFRDMLREATQGVRRAHQPPIIPMPPGQKLESIPLKSNPTDSGWDSFMNLCSSLTGAGLYKTHPSVLGMEKWAGGQGRGMGNHDDSEEIDLAQEEGLVGDVRHLLDAIVTPLAQRCHPALRVVLETGIKPKATAELHSEIAKVSTTRNEIRIEEGRVPFGFYLTDDEYRVADEATRAKHEKNPWNWTTDPAFGSAMAMQAQAQQPGAPAPGGTDDGFGGSDDGFGGSMGQASNPYGTPEGEASDPQQAAAPAPAPAGPAQAPMAKARRRRRTLIHVYDRETYP